MPPIADILARSSDDSPFKIIGGVIVLLIWVIGAIISAINKRAEEAKRQRQLGQLPQDVTFPTAPRSVGYSPAPPPMPAKAGGKKSGNKKRRPVVAAVPVAAAAPAIGGLRERMAGTPTDEPPVRKTQ